jgi:putative CocE/NonD family hydrolase
MSLMSRLMGWMARLPPAETHAVAVEKDLQVPMPDGAILLADHYTPRALGPRPTLLMRSPYGERVRAGWMGQLLAEQGFHVLLQSCRGTFRSGGKFDPFRGEREDGLATLAWLKQQHWFNGELATYGTSYSGFTAWAVASQADSTLKALSTQITGADFRSMLYPGNALALEVFVGWMSTVQAQQGSLWRYFLNTLGSTRKRQRACWHLPLMELDEVLFGTPIAYWREWLSHEQPEDAWWASSDAHERVYEISAPNHLVGGWYDFMLPSLLRDYQALAQAGHRPYLTIGPWTHFDTGVSMLGMREAVAWFRAHLLGDRSRLRSSPVRLFVRGAGDWRDLEAFPPATMHQHLWYLQPGSGLANMVPPASEPDHYRYDPARPTPSVGGAARSFATGPGSQDNRPLEARPDVLTYTSAPLERDMEVMGPVSADLFVRSSLSHTDFFVRVTDVEPRAASLNVCDGLQRLFPSQAAQEGDGCLKVHIELFPTAYRFRRGHRVRVQVSSGAFPRFARNLGSGEPLSTATMLCVAEQHIYHDPAHPSVIILPIVNEHQEPKETEAR